MTDLVSTTRELLIGALGTGRRSPVNSHSQDKPIK